MIRRTAFAVALLVLIASAMAMATIAVTRYPAFLAQPSARTFLLEPLLAFVTYAVAIVFTAVRMRGANSDTVLRNAALFGSATGVIEIANIAIENGIPFAVRGPALQIAMMILIFAVWGFAGFRTSKVLCSIRSGILTSVFSAGICMLIAVAMGFAMEFFLVPARPDYVATWGEFQRSGWTDARAFGIANALDAGFSHLVIAPIIASVFGSLAAWLARFKSSSA
jgi:hypothetical protein